MAAGLMKKGAAVECPSMLVLISTSDTSLRMRGRSMIRRKRLLFQPCDTRSVAADE